MTVSVFFQFPPLIHTSFKECIYSEYIHFYFFAPVSNIVGVFSPGCKVLVGEEEHVAEGTTCLNGTEVGQLGLFGE